MRYLLLAVLLVFCSKEFILLSSAFAETLARAHGRCKLTDRDGTEFNGYCTVKQKLSGGTNVFVVELDDGSNYRFYGPSKQALQIETYDGIRDVDFKEGSDRGVFTWNERNNINTLSVKLDSQHNPGANHDSSGKEAAGVALGVAAGALIAALVAGKASSDSKSSGTVAGLSDLVGAKAGQAENTVIDRGYTWIKTNNEGGASYGYWRESGSNNCVVIRTEDGRYKSIIYTPGFDCK